VAIASTDYVAADRVGIEAMGINPEWIGYLNCCGQARLGQADLGKIELRGVKLADVTRKYQNARRHRARVEMDGPNDGHPGKVGLTLIARPPPRLPVAASRKSAALRAWVKGATLLPDAATGSLNIDSKKYAELRLQNPTEIVFGRGSIPQIAGRIPRMLASCSSTGPVPFKRNGVYEQVLAALQGRRVVEFAGIEPNPLYETCLKAVEVLKKGN